MVRVDQLPIHTMSKSQNVWTGEHADFLDQLDKQGLTRSEMSVAMSKQFKFRITLDHVGRLLSKMRTPGNELFRNTPYRVSAKRTSV